MWTPPCALVEFLGGSAEYLAARLLLVCACAEGAFPFSPLFPYRGKHRYSRIRRGACLLRGERMGILI